MGESLDCRPNEKLLVLVSHVAQAGLHDFCETLQDDAEVLIFAFSYFALQHFLDDVEERIQKLMVDDFLEYFVWEGDEASINDLL